MLLSGWLFTWKSLAPDFSRLNPVKGVGRMFSLHSLVELCQGAPQGRAYRRDGDLDGLASQGSGALIDCRAACGGSRPHGLNWSS